MTKYRITDMVDTQPGKCTNCGASRTDGRKYIDCGVEVEFYGAIIFCSLCVTDMARNLGLFRALELKILQLEEHIAELKNSRDIREELKKTVLLTYEQIKELFDERINNPVDNSDLIDSIVTDSDRLAGEQGTISSTNSTSSKSGSSKPESRTTQQTSKSRSTNVPSLAELISNDGK